MHYTIIVFILLPVVDNNTIQEGKIMTLQNSIRLVGALFAVLVSLVVISPARAGEYTDTINMFKKAAESSTFFKNGYGYAVFPTVGKGGIGIGGAFGKGRVYQKGKYIGDTSVSQLTVGLQFGGQAYSQIIFFEDQRSLQEFTSGNFEFGAEASAVAITAAAGAKTSTTGTSVNASGNKNDATVAGQYQKGMATFTVAKGGLMYEATIGGQKFSYKPR